jgi:hypothetical protein
MTLAIVAIPTLLHGQIDTTRTTPLDPADSTLFVPADSSTQSTMPFQSSSDTTSPTTAFESVESSRSVRLGFFGGADFTMQDAAIVLAKQRLDNGEFCQCQYSEGTGFGYNAGLALSFSFSNDLYSQNIRFAYALRHARSTAYDSIYVGRPPGMLEVTEERFDLSFNSLNFEILFTRTLPIRGASFYVTAGPSLGLVLTNHYTLTLVTSSSETKPDEGTLENIEHLYTSLIGGVGARIRLGRSTALLQPEILYTYPLDRISRRYAWSFQSIRGNLALMFTL